ncbi:flagellar type III secretion system pore protein FliP [Pleionea sediminis]|uniref:flagellar type III secretion system pore protein FliP n=1 Tax=Pleionea sediminis TaxID=2569479 RepID=UPI0013DE4193|nr:flagellar type III secretion system pore protein FliP [Pleionea sediminis]
MSDPMQILILVTSLSFIPLLVVAATTFTRFVIVFSMLRFALGLQQTPPNLVIITLSVFLSIFVMKDPLNELYSETITPYIAKELSAEDAFQKGSLTLTKFMVTQTKEEDLALFVKLSDSQMPKTVEEVEFTQIIPAFLLSELRTAFKIGFMIFLPFLLVDLVVSSVLMSLGMIMLPPVTISLPIKIMLFVLIDGWNLVVQSLISSVRF